MKRNSSLKILGWGGLLLILALSGCISTAAPMEEFVLARIAIDAAKTIEASRYSPGNWHKAEESYRRAQALFDEREFAEAKQEFIKARIAAEKAENSARVQRFKNGDVL